MVKVGTWDLFPGKRAKHPSSANPMASSRQHTRPRGPPSCANGQLKQSSPPLCKSVMGGGEVSLKRKGQDAPLQEEKRQKAAPEKVAEKALVECMRPSVPGGEGPPRSCRWKGLEAPFHDGGGLASPGRWSPGMRKVLEGDAWRSVRHHLLLEAVRVLGSVSEVEKEAYRMAKGGDNFKLVREESILQRIRQVLAEKLDIAPQEATILFGPHERDLEKAGGPVGVSWSRQRPGSHWAC